MSPPPPSTDDEVPAYWRALGLPGLVDVHVHFLPAGMLTKVWSYFDRVGERFGEPWPIHYRVDDAERLQRLHALGVRAFPALAYPHKPGMAAWLNDWTVDFARRAPGCLPSATFFPEPDAVETTRAALDAGARIFKAHLPVGGYDPRDPLLDGVWGLLAEAGVPVVVHSGSGPDEPTPYTGAGPIGEVLRRHPRLVAVIAHLGMPEYAEHAALAERHSGVHLDTTMAGTDFIERRAPMPPDLPSRLADLGDRVLLGSDFPNIPYSYAHQVAALARLDLGEAWLRAVLHDNGARMLGLDRPG